MNSPALNFLLNQKSIIYASKIFFCTMICWYGLILIGIQNPIWAVITVFVVSDPSLTTTFGLAKVRIINTIVGCIFGLSSILFFGYSPLTMILTAVITVFCVNLITRYPVNWRLAPVTVVILMDAGRLATTHEEEFHYVLMRLLEIGVGSTVALGMAGIYTKLAARKKEETVNPPEKAHQAE